MGYYQAKQPLGLQQSGRKGMKKGQHLPGTDWWKNLTGSKKTVSTYSGDRNLTDLRKAERAKLERAKKARQASSLGKNFNDLNKSDKEKLSNKKALASAKDRKMDRDGKKTAITSGKSWNDLNREDRRKSKLTEEQLAAEKFNELPSYAQNANIREQNKKLDAEKANKEKLEKERQKRKKQKNFEQKVKQDAVTAKNKIKKFIKKSMSK